RSLGDEYYVFGGKVHMPDQAELHELENMLLTASRESSGPEGDDVLEPTDGTKRHASAECSHALSFRPVVPGDREALERKCLAYRKADRQSFEPDRLRDALDAVFGRDPLVRVWIIEIGSRAVGYLAITLGFSLEAGGGDAFVDELYIDETVRG